MRKSKALWIGFLIITLALTPAVLCGDAFGPAAARFFGRTAQAAEKAVSGQEQRTAAGWLTRLFSAAEEEYAEEFSLEVAPIPEEALGEVTRYEGTRSRVLIYHTHTNEAYEQVTPAYAETGKWRTNDNHFNVAAVGEVLTQELRKRRFAVIHDQTNHAIPKLSTAYSRSLITMGKYPDMDYYIDLHRDAYYPEVDGDTAMEVNGVMTAKIGLVVGRAEGDLYPEKPEVEKTLALAKRLEKELNRLAPGICKPVIVRKERFNQHFSPGCMLIEVGHNKNTLAEAKNAALIVAEALNNVLE